MEYILGLFGPGASGHFATALSYISANLTKLQSLKRDTDDVTLRDIYTELVAAKILSFLMSAEARLAGDINDAGFGESIDELHEFDEAFEVPNCDVVCAYPARFSIAQCATNDPKTYNAVEVMDELCDMYRVFRPVVTVQDPSPAAQAFLADMEKYLQQVMERIWIKSDGTAGVDATTISVWELDHRELPRSQRSSRVAAFRWSA
jgi:hypothetical protein